MKDLLMTYMGTYWAPLIFILFGITLLYLTYKSPELKKGSFRGDISGCAGGIGAIALGFAVLIKLILEDLKVWLE